MLYWTWPEASWASFLARYGAAGRIERTGTLWPKRETSYRSMEGMRQGQEGKEKT